MLEVSISMSREDGEDFFTFISMFLSIMSYYCRFFSIPFILNVSIFAVRKT